MKTYLKTVLAIIIIAFSACEKDPTFAIRSINDDETNVSFITETSAVVNIRTVVIESGEYYNYNHKTLEVYYSTSSNPFIEPHKCVSETLHWAGTHTATLSNLEPGTTYYYAVKLGNQSGKVRSFKTKGIASISVTTGNVTNITISSATLFGSCTLINDAVLQESGILLHTTSSVSYSNYTMRYYGTSTEFKAEAKDLTSNATYYYCAYAIDDKGNKYYGEVKSFETLMYKATLSEFLGTYQVKYDRGADDFNAYDFPDPKDQTTCSSWKYNQTGTATISKITAPSEASGQWVKMTFTPYESSSWSLSGKYDEDKYCICLYGDVAGDYTIPGLNASGGICPDCGVWAGMFYGHFTMPIYKSGYYIYLLSSGYGYKGSVEIQLVKSGPNAQIEFNAPDKDKNFGYYPNGIGRYDAWCGSPDSQGSFRWGTMDGGVEYVNLTFTKQ